jgi:membrane-associated PAP2 superfamily phosphatase
MSRPGATPPWRWRERECGWIAAALAVSCVVFSLWPQLDLTVSSWFVATGRGFVGNDFGAVVAMHAAVPWLGRAALVAGLLVALLGWWRPRWIRRHARRRAVALALCMLFGVGMLVNGVLKEQWGRSRPAAVVDFGGAVPFEPALRPGDLCRTNCSFVSGHAATGFAVLSVGLFAAPGRRRRWLLAGLAAGTVVGIGRIAQGGHFASDVVFAGLVVWASAAAVRHAWLLAKRRRLQRPAPSSAGSPVESQGTNATISVPAKIASMAGRTDTAT